MLRVQKFISQLVSRKPHSIRKLHAEPKRRRRYPNDDDDDDDGEKTTRRGRQEETHLCLRKSKGQHLLTNQRVLDSIVKKSEIKPSDTVLEIGPGTGNLTLKLLEVARNVVAVEVDCRMVEILQKRVSECGLGDRLSVIREDVLKTELPRFDLVVANIPYNISSPLVAKLVYGSRSFRSATLLLQKEFAKRMMAEPGDSEFNRLAVNVNLVADVEYVMDVSKREFFPCPKVDSSVVIMRPKSHLPDVNLDEWCAFTRTCFCTKNKTLRATFKQKKKVLELLRLSEIAVSSSETSDSLQNCDFTNHDEEGHGENSNGDDEPCSFPGADLQASLFREKIMRVLKSGGFEDKRPSKMSNEDFMCLLKLFNQAGIYFQDRSNNKARDSNEALVVAHELLCNPS